MKPKICIISPSPLWLGAWRFAVMSGSQPLMAGTSASIDDAMHEVVSHWKGAVKFMVLDKPTEYFPEKVAP